MDPQLPFFGENNLPPWHPLAPRFYHSGSCRLTWLVSTDWSWGRAYLLWKRSWGFQGKHVWKVWTMATIRLHSEPSILFPWQAVTAMCCPRNCWKTIPMGSVTPHAAFTLSFSYLEVILLQPNLWKKVWKLVYLFKMFCPIKTFITFSVKLHQWGNITG